MNHSVAVMMMSVLRSTFRPLLSPTSARWTMSSSPVFHTLLSRSCIALILVGVLTLFVAFCVHVGVGNYPHQRLQALGRNHSASSKRNERVAVQARAKVLRSPFALCSFVVSASASPARLACAHRIVHLKCRCAFDMLALYAMDKTPRVFLTILQLELTHYAGT